MTNQLGTKTNLTGIPSLLISGLQQIPDPTTQTALYQVQNWANSFFPWQYGAPSGTYATGGVTIAFGAPYQEAVFALTFGFSNPVIAGSVVSLAVGGFKIELFGSGGTQISNGSSYQFSYMAIGV